MSDHSMTMTTHAVYYIYCPKDHPADYVGSVKNGMRDRWNKYTTDIRNKRWTVCGLTRHFGDHHQADMEEAIKRLLLWTGAEDWRISRRWSIDGYVTWGQ